MAIDTIKSSAVLDGAIATADIANDAVTSAKLGSITDIASSSGAMTLSPAGTEVVNVGTTGDIIVKGNGNNRAALLLRAGSNTANSQIQLGDQASDTSGRIMYDHSDDTMRFNTAGTERFRVSASGIHIGGTGAANALDDYEEGEFSFTLTDNHGGSDTTNKMRYVKVGAMVFVEGPNRGSAGSNVQQYALLSGTANSDITLTATLPFVPIETGMAISGIHRNLEKRDGSNENASSGNWLPMIGWIAGSATLTLTDTQSEKSYSAAAGGMTLRKADNRTNIVMGFNFAYRTAS